MNETLMMTSTGLLVVFSFLSIFDGIYFHLWKFRLQEKEDSKFEHLTHTARAILFIPALVLIYSIGISGLLAWIALFVLGLDLVVEVFDVLNEKKSRAAIGGLPSEEYLLHIILTTLRVAALTLAFASIPAEAWSLTTDYHASAIEISKFAVTQLLPGAILTAAFHLYLIFDPFFVSRTEKSFCSRFCKNGSSSV
jgi:hypothetical protein